jgi:hypothetical protein
MQTIIVDSDKHDPDRIMITIREASGFGHTVRVEKILIPQLIIDLEHQLPEESIVVDDEVGDDDAG